MNISRKWYMSKGRGWQKGKDSIVCWLTWDVENLGQSLPCFNKKSHPCANRYRHSQGKFCWISIFQQKPTFCQAVPNKGRAAHQWELQTETGRDTQTGWKRFLSASLSAVASLGKYNHTLLWRSCFHVSTCSYCSQGPDGDLSKGKGYWKDTGANHQTLDL